MLSFEDRPALHHMYAVWALLVVFFVLGLGSWHNTHTASASGTISLSGYAWSDAPNNNPAGDRGAGWISFSHLNCDANSNGLSDGTPAGCPSTGTVMDNTYGVTEDGTTGALSGQAWSENIGWISFKPTDLVGCPSGACTAQVSSGAVTGWARALAHDSSWDGWIELSPPNVTGVDVLKQDPATCAWSGYAWGSNVLGWIHMSGTGYGVTGTGGSCAPPPPPSGPTVNLSASPPAWYNNTGGLTTFTWTSSGATTCHNTITNDNGNPTVSTGGVLNGSASANVPRSANYTLVCTDSNTGLTGSGSTAVTVAGPGLTDFHASPSRVAKGQPSSLIWSSNGFNSCSIVDSSNPQKQIVGTDAQGHGGPTSSDADGTPTPDITQQTVYTLTCIGASGTASEIATVSLVPSFIEK